MRRNLPDPGCRCTRLPTRPRCLDALASDSGSGATGGTGGADAGGTGGGGYGGGGGSSIGDCGLYWSAGPDAGIELAACTKEDGGGYACRCGEEMHEGVSAPTCEGAVEQACGVNPNDPQYCMVGEHACWPVPDEPTHWSCLCDGATSTVSATAQWCADAAHFTCATSCSSPRGSCVPAPEVDRYACTCSYYGGPPRITRGYTCEGAINAACYPFNPCNGLNGYCDETDTGFDCYCIDESMVTLTFGAVGSGDCEDAIDSACGHIPVDPDMECEGSSATAQGACHAIVEEPGMYDCWCQYVTDAGAGAFGLPIAASSCQQALQVCLSEH